MLSSLVQQFWCLSELQLKCVSWSSEFREMLLTVFAFQYSLSGAQVVLDLTDACCVCLGVHKQETRLGHWGVFTWLGGHGAGHDGVRSPCLRQVLHPSVAGAHTCMAALQGGGPRPFTHNHSEVQVPRGGLQRSDWGFLNS